MSELKVSIHEVFNRIGRGTEGERWHWNFRELETADARNRKQVYEGCDSRYMLQEVTLNWKASQGSTWRSALTLERGLWWHCDRERTETKTSLDAVIISFFFNYILSKYFKIACIKKQSFLFSINL